MTKTDFICIGKLIFDFFKDNLKDIILLFIGAIIALILKAIWDKINEKFKRKRNQFDADISKFREPFERVLSELIAGKQAAGTIKGMTTEHIKAKEIFRDKLRMFKNERTVRRLDRLWDQYTCKDEDVNQKEYFRGYIAETPDKEKKMNDKAQKNIKAILEFVDKL